MGKTRNCRRAKRPGLHPGRARAIWTTIVAIGGSLAAGQAAALELGAIEVHSKLGQPLRASIAYVPGPNEMLESHCITLAPDRNNFLAVSGTRVGVANGIISLTGTTPITEPLLTANLVVRCPYTADISRSYSMFIDPAGRPDSDEAARTSGQTAAASAAPPAKDGIFEVNPQALTDRDPGQPRPDSPASDEAIAGESNADVGPGDSLADEPADLDAVPGSSLYEPKATLATDRSETEPAAATVSPVASTEFAEAVESNETKAAPARILTDRGAAVAGGVENWLPWAIATILAGISAYFAFSLRRRFRARSAAAAPVAERRVSYPKAITIPESEIQVVEIQPHYPTVDFDLSDDAPTEENLALDADLFSGAGLAAAGDGHDEHDFIFAEATSLDTELPDLPEMKDMTATDIIAPPERLGEDMILDSEVLPDDDYDMSIIVDATKMPDPDDVTERDLQAVPVDDEQDDSLITDAYTIEDETAEMSTRKKGSR